MKYAYRLIRSDRRSISVELARNGEILVRAPRRMKTEEIGRWLDEKEPWIDKHYDAWKKKTEAAAAFSPTEAEIRAFADHITARVRYYAAVMGVTPTSIRITDARTRYGSCSPKNGICFSVRLLTHSDAAIDYVVVHELAHIRQKNHGAAFYREVEKILPDYKEREKLLKTEI